MDTLFLLLFFASIIALVVGLIKPIIFTRFLKDKATRKGVGTIFGIATVAFFILFAITTDTDTPTTRQDTDRQTETSTEITWALNYKIVKEEDNSMKALGDRPLSSYSSEELDALPLSKRMRYRALVLANDDQINENSIRATANKIIQDLTSQDTSIDVIFLLMYLDENRVDDSYDLASVVWAPQGDPVKVDSNIVSNRDRSTYQTKVEMNRNLAEYLETRKRHRGSVATSTVENIGLTLNANLSLNVLRVSGNANLPDGALISYEISHESWGTRIFSPAEMDVRFAGGTTEVRNGKYEFSINVAQWPSGNIETWVAFQTILGTTVKQPQGVIGLYGEMGEKIPDASAVQSGPLKRVEQISSVRK